MSRTKFKAISHNRVSTSHYFDEWDKLLTIEYFAPIDGGYVRFAGGGQVCDKLYARGNTLLWSNEKPLIDIIRREHEKRLRHLRKFNKL